MSAIVAAFIVFVSLTGTANAADPLPPQAVVISPSANQQVPLGVVTIAGTATDDSGVAIVRLAIRNRTTLQYWSGSQWINPLTWVSAGLESPGASSTAWAYAWTPPATAPINVTAVAVDDTGLADPPPRPFVNFAVGQPVDTTPPNTTMNAPVDGAVLGAGTVTITGQATDARSVNNVHVRIQDVATGLWWGDPYWYPNEIVWRYTGEGSHDTTISWSAFFSPPYAGTFRAVATAYDQSNNPDPTPATAVFTVTSAPSDTVRPLLNILTPAWSAGVGTYPNAPMTIKGTVLDNVSLQLVRLAIRVRGVDLWWNGTTFVPGFRWVSAIVSSSPQPWSDWTYPWTPPGPGSYQMMADVIDGAGNGVATPRPYRNFDIASS